MIIPSDDEAKGLRAQLDRQAAVHRKWAAERDELRAAVERVRALHQPTDGMGYRDGDYGEMAPVCTTCGTAVEYGVPYPCATLAALDGRDGE